jgi:hypothetical protein
VGFAPAPGGSGVGVTLRGCVDVEVEAVLALVLQVGQQPLEVLQPAPGHPFERGGLVGDVRQALGADGAELVGDLDARPQRPPSPGA